jgi:hypothetical protein
MGIVAVAGSAASTNHSELRTPMVTVTATATILGIGDLIGEPRSLYHLVSTGEYRGRDCQAERLAGFEVDHWLELGRLLDWKIGALQSPSRVNAQ